MLAVYTSVGCESSRSVGVDATPWSFIATVCVVRCSFMCRQVKSSQVTSISVDFSRRTGYCRPRGAVDSGLAAVLAAVESVAVFVRVCRVSECVSLDLSVDGCDWVRPCDPCARVRPCVPCVPCGSRRPPVSLRHRGSRVCTRAKTGTPCLVYNYTCIICLPLSLPRSHDPPHTFIQGFHTGSFIVSFASRRVLHAGAAVPTHREPP